MTPGRAVKRWVWALLLSLATACAPRALGSAARDGVPSTTPDLIGPVWQLTAYSDARGNLVAILPDTQSTATFGSTGFVTGSGGCNEYSTVFQTTAMTLSFIGPITTTRQMCAQRVMDQEHAYLAALARTATYRFEGGGHLVLIQSDGSTLAQYSH